MLGFLKKKDLSHTKYNKYRMYQQKEIDIRVEMPY